MGVRKSDPGRVGLAREAVGQGPLAPCCSPGGHPGTGSYYSPAPRSSHAGRARPVTNRTSRTQSLWGQEVGSVVGPEPWRPGLVLAPGPAQAPPNRSPPTLLAQCASPAWWATAAIAVDLIHTGGPVSAGRGLALVDVCREVARLSQHGGQCPTQAPRRHKAAGEARASQRSSVGAAWASSCPRGP